MKPIEQNAWQPGARKKATMADIAASLGVSKNSVSIALGDKSGISDDLRRRVIDRAVEMNYGGFAAKESGENRCVAVVVPEYLHNDAFFYSEVFWAVETEVKRRGGLSINIGVSREMESAGLLPSLPKELRVVGLLVVGVMSKSYVEKLYAMGLPMLSVDIAYENVPIGCVGSANLSGGFAATRCLIDHGHRRIGFVGPVNTALSIYERWCGFRLAMRQAGLSAEAPYNIVGDRPDFQLFDTTEALEAHLSALKETPTAWFCAGDRIAIALMNWLAQRGLRVPDDISVIGFDDLSVAQMVLPRLTTIRIDRRQMGRLAVENLFTLAKDRDRAPVNADVLGTLILRDSVRNL